MAKKSRLDELESVDGPFQVPESMFADADSPPPDDDPPAFSDDDVKKIMGEEEQSWVTEGEPELAPAEPPPPPALPDDGNWVTEGAPEPEANQTWVSDTPEPAQRDRNLYQDVSEAPAADLPDSGTPSYIVEEAPKPKRAVPMDSSGLVMHPGEEDRTTAAPVAQGEDLGTSALTWMSLAVGGVMVGVLGAILVVLLLTTATAPVESTKPSLPETGKDPEGIQVRRGLNGPPAEPKVTNPEEPKDEEGEGDDVPDGAPPSDVPDGGPPP